MKTIFPRSSGVLLHLASLSNLYGIGSMGQEAFRFIDFLSAGGFRFWQMCPIGPTGFGDSPYQTFSAFAGNPYFLDLEDLVEKNLLSSEDLDPLRRLPKERVDYGELYKHFWPILKKAYVCFTSSKKPIDESLTFEQFKTHAKDWLEPYSIFMALKAHHEGASWMEWPAGRRSYEKALHDPMVKELEESIESWQFYQYLFELQWRSLRAYAQAKQIELIGDIPIFVASDSADFWANPKLFEINENGLPSSQAGVPPDYFSPTGQLWGNPLYAWEAHKADDYAWWKARLGRTLELFDVVRIDHFRAFESYWRIPIGAENAIKGTWEKGPGLEFFHAVEFYFQQKGQPCRLIAEDLGDITPEVYELLKATGLPGMAVLQFGFGGDAQNLHLPHLHKAHQVLYPGTHDNDTFRGWYEHADPKTQDHIRSYLSVSGDAIGWDAIRAVFKSVANGAIIPLQDILSLDSEGRFNTPGTSQGNWSWRCPSNALKNLQENGTVNYLRGLNALYGRLG